MEDVQCQPEATRLVLAWTVPAGDVGTCLVVAEQLAAGGDAHLVFQAKTLRGSVLLSSLAPATSYRLSLSVLGRNGLWSRAVTLVCATSAQGRCFLVLGALLPVFSSLPMALRPWALLSPSPPPPGPPKPGPSCFTLPTPPPTPSLPPGHGTTPALSPPLPLGPPAPCPPAPPGPSPFLPP